MVKLISMPRGWICQSHFCHLFQDLTVTWVDFWYQSLKKNYQKPLTLYLFLAEK
ncbi:MAG: hypothetical protein ACI9W1_003038, partial [Candidatus Azotimanducaceae bacterium]